MARYYASESALETGPTGVLQTNLFNPRLEIESPDRPNRASSPEEETV